VIVAIFELLGAGLRLWSDEAKLRYKKKLYRLEKKYYEESNKDKPDHAVLDDIEFELQLLARSFASEIEKSAVETVPR